MDANFKILETLRLDWDRQFGHEFENFMQKIFFVDVATYEAILDIRGRLPSHLERSLYQEPSSLEDEIGRIAPAVSSTLGKLLTPYLN